MNQKMRGHQLFNLITKISQKVLTPFLSSLVCLNQPSLESKNGGVLSINTVYVGTKVNILQAFDNQFSIYRFQRWIYSFETGLALKSKGVNKYQFATLERVDSAYNSLFLPPSPPLNRKRFYSSLFQSAQEVGNNCICIHQEVLG